jgi:hypothetical protein
MEQVRKNDRGINTPMLRYTGDPFAPASHTYQIADLKTFNMSTIVDSGYGPTVVGRISDLGPVAPLALAAFWEAAFAFEAGPLSTWRN